ncbi:head-tail connector protein [Micromonospora sp. CA-246542]|uniref:head-tail connector protein n=1 Tax=Micromonospora sp. CA-246542 TaxID=3239959 RepID=UPI003D942E54
MTWEPDYVTVAEAKAYLRIEDDADDALVATWVTTASRAVDTFCHRQFGQVDTPQARTFGGVWDRTERSYLFEIDDLMDITGLVAVDSAGVVVDLSAVLRPHNAPQRGKPYTRVVAYSPVLTITALWGWSAVPAAVKNATLIQTARFAARRDSPFGVAGSPSEGGETRLLAALDPDLKTSLGSKYRREWWAA